MLHDRSEQPASTPTTTVIRIIDGDTIQVQVNGHPETVRLIGVDTAETKDPRKPVQYFGKMVSPELDSLSAPG